MLDKGIELNPNNTSFHPVEAAGRNQTDAMAQSLAGTSPYKQWDFTTDATVRCANCHGDPAGLVPALPVAGQTPTAAGDDISPHTSQYWGLLLQNYRDGRFPGTAPLAGQGLKPATEPYAEQDFSLCYLCHAEAPFLNTATGATNFDNHASHLTGHAAKGSNPDPSIDTPGAGQGNAICAECHFRIHGTALAYNVADRGNPALVNFAPNVEPLNGVLTFTKTATGGTCTLVCHGAPHDNKSYP